MKFLELKVPPVAVVIVYLGLMTIVAQQWPGYILLLPYQALIAIMLTLSGVAIALFGVVSFRKAKTTVNPTKPSSASSVVDSGIFRFTRNPMYLGMLMLLVGYAVELAALSSYLLALTFIFYMNQFQIKPEERALEALFGQDYTDYKRNVRRWI
tara:strand:- start:140 stop:601 length:462 start_codon:yes stop_codon:yes gene_type:complete